MQRQQVTNPEATMPRMTVLAILKTAAKRRGGPISRRSLSLLAAEIADGRPAFANYIDNRDMKRLVGEAFNEMYRDWRDDPDRDPGLKFLED